MKKTEIIKALNKEVYSNQKVLGEELIDDFLCDHAYYFHKLTMRGIKSMEIIHKVFLFQSHAYVVFTFEDRYGNIVESDSIDVEDYVITFE